MAIEFNIEESKKIKGVYIITPNISTDLRGNIWTSFLKDEIEKLLPKGLYFKHDKFSKSCQNVLRGIHGDYKSWKYVTCVYGDIFQVVVDCRKNSSTYLKWESFDINKDNQRMILIPPNMGNAYYAKSKEVIYHYKLAYDGEYLDAKEQFTFAWNDDKININWPTNNPILSDRDMLSEN
ncbi:dTDP-4-dehydrorhamnose 3,5-epimerase family protein [Campylobacter sp. CNRCH_2014_0184h]|uniref:dTDP-4-dehydrorhamnose 3,5-epimerase family protein n=1 Tax=Campylobacter sp. CNRCH_2014_0184h TaxID=2911602 RepID=UPI0021E66FB4|nr:dTDP-4-dehydrorhamnose 3,5-epimerase family protein [Campylobacter sp. CNRCH_2014_0184h]MCV3480619.1 dTDP-4-dehydrorhamnose 3,5-epimerase family protein [Campylobacter lari]MCV3482722.1 dTDP-4-dehydrorhamnose 3,5-epimerase family protein [Campylobacter sp. CNRCH_2014_0184h]